MSIIAKYKEKILNGQTIAFDEALYIINNSIPEELYIAANEIKEKFYLNKVDLCSIINAKSGNCSENCKFCAQSGHYNTNISTYSLIDSEKALKIAKENYSQGIHRISLVTSGNTLTAKDFEKILSLYKAIKKETKLSLCASLGAISYEQAVKLKEIGLNMYHHNVETSSDYYPNICTTHTYESRIKTIKNAAKAGLKICCGGIIGMGESMEQRIKMACEIRELEAVSVPINILNPIKGTPMYKAAKKLDTTEILKTFAIFKLILPKASIRYAAGRSQLGKSQEMGLKAGVSGMMVGNFLTTNGNEISEDIEMIKALGFTI